ncbi:hypothetical protein HDE_14225 [Halotydeus destructor]|nr:hypothetical protein HDE_14225 [Halotydeus destructor]
MVVPWMLYVIYCLFGDLVQWHVKGHDLVQFLYMDLGLGLVYVMITGIKSRSGTTLHVSMVVLFILGFAYFLYLPYLSGQDENSIQMLLIPISLSLTFGLPGRHVTRHYNNLETTEEMDRRRSMT